jgi:hypothetical protein
VGQEFGHEMRMLVLYEKAASFVVPTLDASATNQDGLKWSKDYDLFIKQKTKHNDEKAKVSAMILSCCNKPLKNKVKRHLKYAQMEQDCDMAALLEVITESTLICMSKNIQHVRLQVLGSNWHLAITKWAKQ